MHVLALRLELHLPGVDSLKEKRSILTPILDHGWFHLTFVLYWLVHLSIIGTAIWLMASAIPGSAMDRVRFSSLAELRIACPRRRTLLMSA